MTIKDILSSDTHFVMKYVDGEEKLTPGEMAINKVIFKLPSFLKLPIKKKYSIVNYFTNGMFSKKTISNAYTAILKDIFENDIDIHLRLEDDITKIILLGVEEIQNQIALKSPEHEGSIILSELIDIQMEPELLKSIDTLDKSPSPANVSKVFDTVKKIIFSEKYKNNSVAIAYVSETVSPRQLNQCLGVRGYAFDLSNQIYQKPIATSYVLGLRDMMDVAKESRGAAIALRNSTEAIGKSETFAREMQMICSVVENLVRTDCGSTKGVTWLVTDGALNTLIGQGYKLKEEDNWQIIKTSDTHLIGQIIILRTTLSCELKDKDSVCIRCYGSFGYHAPSKKEGYNGFNIGFWSSTKMNEPASQSLLSSKHYLVSADGGVFELSGEDRKFLSIKNNKIKMVVNHRDFVEANIRIPEESLMGLKNISEDNISSSIEIWNISKIKKFTIELIPKKGDTITHVVDIGRHDKYALITKALVSHAIRKKYKHEKGEFVISMKGYPMNGVICVVPDTVFDYNEYNNRLQSILKKSQSAEGERILNTKDLLASLHQFINSKLYCHVSALAMVAYSMSVKDRVNLDYDLNRGLESDVSTCAKILNNRTTALTIAYGGAAKIFETKIIDQNNQTPHPISVLFDPKGILNN